MGPVTSFDVTRFCVYLRMLRATLLKNNCQQIEISKAVLAVAGPVEDDRCVLTNCSWVVDARELYETFRLEARIINDFEAVAYSLPSLAPPDLVGIGRRGKSRTRGSDGRAGTGKRVRHRLPGARGRKAHSHFERGRDMQR